MRQLELGPAEFERDEAARGLVEDFNAGDTPKLKIIHSPEPMHDATHDLSSNALACGVLFDTPASMIAATVGVWAMYVGIST